MKNSAALTPSSLSRGSTRYRKWGSSDRVMAV